MDNNAGYLKFGRVAVYLNIAGIILSGLVFPVYASLVHPQPPWQDAALFIQSYHPVQTMTFFFGYLLITGSLLTFIALYAMADEDKKLYALAGLIVHALFAVIVFLNYIIQTTYVPYLASANPPEAAFILPVLSMSNAGSLAWALEMWGWGGIGLSYLFMATIFGASPEGRLLKMLFIGNGSASMISAFATSVNMTWIFTPAGFSSLILWNLLVLFIDIVLIKYFNKMNYQHKVFFQ